MKHTPESKEKLRQKALERHRNRKRAAIAAGIQQPQNGSRPHARTEDPTHEQVTFAFGHVSGWLSAYAAGTGTSPVALAERISELLHPNTGRSARRLGDQVRDLRAPTAG